MTIERQRRLLEAALARKERTAAKLQAAWDADNEAEQRVSTLRRALAAFESAE